MKKGGLFAVSSSPMEDMMGEDDDFSGDEMPAEEEGEEPELGAGPFDAYAETIFSDDADLPSKADALRQAILTILEERGR